MLFFMNLRQSLFWDPMATGLSRFVRCMQIHTSKIAGVTLHSWRCQKLVTFVSLDQSIIGLFIDSNFFLYFLCLSDLPDVHSLLEPRHSKWIQRNWLFLKSFYNFLPNLNILLSLAWVLGRSVFFPQFFKDQLQIPTIPGFFWSQILLGCLFGLFVWKANENGHYDLVQVMERLWKSHQKHLGGEPSNHMYWVHQRGMYLGPEAKEGRWHGMDLKPSLEVGRIEGLRYSYLGWWPEFVEFCLKFPSLLVKLLYRGVEFCMNHSG